MLISWTEEELQKFYKVEPELALVDEEGEEESDWLNHFLNGDFKEEWDADKLIESLKKDKEDSVSVEQVFQKYYV